MKKPQKFLAGPRGSLLARHELMLQVAWLHSLNSSNYKQGSDHNADQTKYNKYESHDWWKSLPVPRRIVTSVLREEGSTPQSFPECGRHDGSIGDLYLKTSNAGCFSRTVNNMYRLGMVQARYLELQFIRGREKWLLPRVPRSECATGNTKSGVQVNIWIIPRVILYWTWVQIIFGALDLNWVLFEFFWTLEFHIETVVTWPQFLCLHLS